MKGRSRMEGLVGMESTIDSVCHGMRRRTRPLTIPQLAWSCIIVILSKSRQWIISLLLGFFIYCSAMFQFTFSRQLYFLDRFLLHWFIRMSFNAFHLPSGNNEYLLYVIMMSISHLIRISHPVHETNYLRSMASFVVPHPSTLAALITSIATVTRLESSYFCTTVTCAMLPILLPSLPTLSLMRFTTWVLWVMSRCRLTCQR